MQIIYINEDKYQYDIHSLFKAFWPHEEVRVIAGNPGDFPEKEEDITGADFVTRINVTGKTKDEVKQEIYRRESEKTGKLLPWGDLTGIRPTRIAMNLIEEGKSDTEVTAFMKEHYFVSDEKSALALEIAKREKEILKRIDYKNGYSIYIGIPFCPTTCLYCSFLSLPIGANSNLVDDYIKCLQREIDYVAESFAGKTLDTVYIGGGTPTTLSADQLKRLIGYLKNRLDMKSVKEFTVESGRPDSITLDKLRVMKKMGVTRISINPQSMSDDTLKLIGRRHSVSDVIDAFNLARDEGFDNINMDIILGLPGETAMNVRHTIDEIKKLRPDDLTVHCLAIKRGSRLFEAMLEKEKNGSLSVSLQKSTDSTEEMMEVAMKGAREMGLLPYYLYRQKNISGNFENTGYALEGKAGIYNILINEEVQSIVALGAGTVTKRVFGYGGRIERCDNVKDLKLYMNSIDEMIERKRKLFEKE
ncbi:MAG: coproporphyrinogen dehydrogenase HemZ [Butyrivibrio sp.]|nr:coproporphyrinogen dehydrogenase HemZ [Butyrivibrio sp.]